MSNIAIKISKRGYDAINASDNELIFNSHKTIPYIVKNENLFYKFTTNPAAGKTVLITADHNLGFKPVIFSFFTDLKPDATARGNQTSYMPWYKFGFTDAFDTWVQMIHYYVTDTQYVVYYEKIVGAGVPIEINDMTGLEFNFKYYVTVI